MTMTPKQVRNLLITLGILLAALLIYLTFTSLTKRAVNLSIAPGSASVIIDGKSVDSNKPRLSIGEHTIKVSQTNFSSVEKKFTVNKSGDNSVSIYLTATNDEGKKYLSDNPGVQTEIEGVASAEVNAKNVAAARKYPFLDKLPLEFQRFTIFYGDSVKTKKTNPDDPYVALYISVTDPTEKRNALRRMHEQLGIDPSDIEIIFNDYFNPFDKAAYDE